MNVYLVYAVRRNPLANRYHGVCIMMLDARTGQPSKKRFKGQGFSLDNPTHISPFDDLLTRTSGNCEFMESGRESVAHSVWLTLDGNGKGGTS